MTLSTSALRSAWAPACKAKGDVYLFAYAALDAWLRHHQYAPRKADTGAYNCRKITGGSGYSLHAYGPGLRFRFWNGVEIATSLAVDLNWQSNPYGKKLVTDMPPAMVADIKAIRTKSGKQVWRWGGDYVSVKDGMHWEIACSPADLATGIDPNTLPRTAGLRTGDKGEGVKFLQAMLNLLAAAGFRNGATGKPGRQIATDGDYGPETRAAVGEFQTFARAMQGLAGVAPKDLLAVDGIAGPDTLGAIAFWVPIAMEQTG